jgi:hypothetical protein
MFDPENASFPSCICTVAKELAGETASAKIIPAAVNNIRRWLWIMVCVLFDLSSLRFRVSQG